MSRDKSKNKKNKVKLEKNTESNKDKKAKVEVKPFKIRNVLKNAYLLLAHNKKAIFKITGIYGLIYFFLVQSFTAPVSATGIKNSFLAAFQNQIHATFNTFSYVVSSNTTDSSSQTSPIFQIILIIIFSLAIIYAFRKMYKNEEIKVKEVIYNSMYPLIPFLIVLIIILIQLLPMDLSLAFYSIITSGGILSNIVELLIFGILFISLILFSLYLVSNSIIALYIVTLSNMTPLASLRSAKQLIKGRRPKVVISLLILPLLLVALAAAVLLPLILFIPAIASWVYIIMLIFALPLVHSYLYSLYRELIK